MSSQEGAKFIYMREISVIASKIIVGNQAAHNDSKQENQS